MEKENIQIKKACFKKKIIDLTKNREVVFVKLKSSKIVCLRLGDCGEENSLLYHFFKNFEESEMRSLNKDDPPEEVLDKDPAMNSLLNGEGFDE